jgi:hypothetical protein
MREDVAVCRRSCVEVGRADERRCIVCRRFCVEVVTDERRRARRD